MIGKKVIIRADRAGLFFGTLKEKNGSEVTDSLRMGGNYGETKAEAIGEMVKIMNR